MLRVQLRAIWHLVDAAGAAEQLTVTQARVFSAVRCRLVGGTRCRMGINKSNGTIHPTSLFLNAKTLTMPSSNVAAFTLMHAASSPVLGVLHG